MSVKIAIGGDVNFSKHRGELSHLTKKTPPPLFLKILNKLKARWGMGVEIDYSPTQIIDEILLAEYGGEWRNPYPQTDDMTKPELPFKKIGRFFRDADIGFVNLETPLTDRGRHVGAFSSSPVYARILAENNIGVVSIANNHSFDAGERGFLETLKTLQKESVIYIGGGHDTGEARRGGFVVSGGLTVGFLGYTSFCNSNFSSLAKDDQAGILPLHESTVLNDIKTAKTKCDFLTVAPHFDFENRPVIHRNSIAMAHKMIDAGADLIVGSHAHLPKAVEIYRGKPIIYCLGNLIFPYAAPEWGNSLVAEVILTDSAELEAVRFFPIHSEGENSFHPYILKDIEGDRLLRKIQRSSAKKFKTRSRLADHKLDLQFSRNDLPGTDLGHG